MKKIIIAKQELQEIYNNLKSQKRTAEYFGVSLKVIKRLVKEYKLGTFEHFIYIPPKNDLISVFQNGGIKKDICKKYNVVNSTVTKWLDHYGISAVKSDYKHLTQEQKSIVVGSILGDGYIDGRILLLNHSLKQEDYLNYKAGYFGTDISGPTYRKTKEGYLSVRRRTKAFGDIKRLKELFFEDKKLIIPENIEELLTPLAIAIWYLDDGSKKGKSYGNIATCSMPMYCCKELSRTLNELIGIQTYATLDTGYPILRIPAKGNSFSKFCDYIRDYVPESMKYKLSEKSLTTIYELP